MRSAGTAQRPARSNGVLPSSLTDWGTTTSWPRTDGAISSTRPTIDSVEGRDRGGCLEHGPDGHTARDVGEIVIGVGARERDDERQGQPGRQPDAHRPGPSGVEGVQDLGRWAAAAPRPSVPA